jgi:polyisoprenyl-teichoic acid--peptidoglycan teichoic acid transferase
MTTESKQAESKKVKKPWHPFLQGILWSFIVSSIVSIFGLLGASLVLFSPFSETITQFLTDKKEKIVKVVKNKTSSPTPVKPISESNKLSRSVNILVLGVEPLVDRDLTANNSVFSGEIDTILLLHFDPVEQSLKLLSIPRDSLLETNNGKIDRLKNINLENDAETTAQIIGKNLGNLTIDRYLRLTTDTVTKLVDVVGGLEIFVPQAVSYEDKTQRLKIDLVAGWQTLDGEKTLQFLRYLDDNNDLGRVQRQQIAIAAFQKRLQNPTIITRIPEAIDILKSNVDTNLSKEETLVLADFSTELSRDNLQMLLLSGRSNTDGSWDIDSEKRDRTLAQFFGQSSINNNVNNNSNVTGLQISIQNTTGRSQLSQKLLKYLNDRNFWNIRIIDDLPMELRETQIIAQTGDINLATKIQEILNFGRVNASATGDLDSEITIQIGDDFNSK